MKTKIIPFLLIFFILSVAPTAHAQPDYAKWGKMAMQATSAKYPNAMITDYKHLGRKELNATTLEESFKLQLREAHETYYVIVKIAFDKTNEKVKNITFEKRQF